MIGCKKNIHTLEAYLRALIDSSKLHDDGLIQQIIKVFAFPPNESFYLI